MQVREAWVGAEQGKLGIVRLTGRRPEDRPLLSPAMPCRQEAQPGVQMRSQECPRPPLATHPQC